MNITASLVISFLTLSIFQTDASGCPTVNNLFDFNCDGIVKIVLIGDSITFGIGDSDNNNKGGYPLRLKNNYFPGAQVETVAKPGISSSELLSYIKVNRRVKKIKDADFAITLVGANDFFHEADPQLVENNVLKIQRFLRLKGVRVRLIGTLLQTLRSYQRDFIDLVNFELDNNAKVRFETLEPEGNLSADNLHPNSLGYDSMALVASTVLTEQSSERHQKFANSDNDQIPDRFEVGKFGTDPLLSDSDGDGVDDYTELFVNMTDPLS